MALRASIQRPGTLGVDSAVPLLLHQCDRERTGRAVPCQAPHSGMIPAVALAHPPVVPPRAISKPRFPPG
ncbi:MAG: hypothetical protein ACRENX_10325, partial [Candidatus Dormibacteria bacterium]